MSPWQLLHANRGSHAAWAHRVHHAAAGSVHYSTAPAAPGGGRGSSFCLSREKQTLQQLNGRLASYLQQVRCLEATNQRLQRQIKEELDSRCPKEVSKELDAHLRTVSHLQGQIVNSLSDQGQLKLLLLCAELTIFDFNVRCEKERKERGRLEAELKDLRLLEEELKVRKLPELQSQLSEFTQQRAELQLQHLQDVQVLQAQVSGGVTVAMQTTESSDLTQQLDHLRGTLVNRHHNEFWSRTEASLLSPLDVTFDPPVGSEGELEELRRMAASLTEELSRLQAEVVQLEGSHRDHTDSFVLQLAVLQQMADRLCGDLDSVLQATVKQAADHEVLLDVKSRLEAEIQDYWRLLDGLSQQGFETMTADVQPLSSGKDKYRGPLWKTSQGTARKSPDPQMVSGLKMTEVQKVSRGHVQIVGQTPAAALLPEPETAVQLVHRVHSKHLKNLPVLSVNTSDLTNSFRRSENQRPGSLVRESTTISTTVNKQISTVGDGDHAEDHVVITKTIHPPQKTTSVPIKPTTAGIQKKTESAGLSLKDQTEDPIHAQISNPAQMISLELETPSETVREDHKIQGEVFGEMTCMEDAGRQGWKGEEARVSRLNQGSENSHVSNSESNKLMEDADTRCSFTNASSGGLNSNNNNESTTLSPQILKTEVDKAEEVSDTNVEPAESDNKLVDDQEVPNPTDPGVGLCSSSPEELLSPEEADLLVNPMDQDASSDHKKRPDRDGEKQGKIEQQEEEEAAEGTLVSLSLDVSFSNLSNSETNKVMEDTDTRSRFVNISDSNSALESTTESPEILKTEMYKSEVLSGTIELKVSPTESDNEVVDIAGQEVTGPTNSGVALSPSGPEELLSPEQADVSMNPTDQVTSLDLKMSPDKDLEEAAEDTVLAPRTELSLSNMSNNEPNKLTEDTNTTSGLKNTSECNHNLQSTTTESTEILNIKVTGGKEVNCFHDANVLKVDCTESEIESVAREEGSKMSLSLTDSGVALGSSGPEEFDALSVKCSSPEICLSPIETDVLMSNQGFFPVDLDLDLVRSPDSPQSPNEPEVYYTPKESPSPVELNTCLSPNEEEEEEGEPDEEDEEEEEEEEDEEACLTLTEANVIVRPVEKYILSTKEADQELAFSNNQALPEDNGNTKVLVSESVRSSEGNEGERVNLNTFSFSSGPTGSRLQTKGSPGGPGGQSIIADKEEQLGFGGLYWRRDSGGVAKEDEKESTDGNLRGQRVFGTSKGGATFCCAAIKSGGTTASGSGNAATAEVQGRFRRGSGDWKVYGGSLGRTSGSEENLATLTALSQSDAGEFGREGSAECIVYGGGFRRTSNIVVGEGNKKTTSVEVKATPQTGGFRRGSGEWMVYGRQTARRSSLPGSESLPNNGSKETPPTAMNLAMSLPGTGRFSRGSGERRVYSGSSGSMSSSGGQKEDFAPVTGQLSTSQAGALATRRFGSEGSGEWRVYGGSSGRVSSAGSTDGVISVPGSYTNSRSRRNSGGSGGKLSSSSVVRRSSSVGSGGRLSSSGSGGRLSSSPGSHRFASTSSGEWKPVYSSASGRRSSVGSTAWPGAGRTTNSQRAPSPGGSGGWQSGSAAGGNRMSGSKANSAGSGDRIGSRTRARVSTSSGSGRTNSTGGRVISSSNRPIRSTGSGTGSNKERISVCKMAALSMSAAGRGRSQDQQPQKAQQQQAAATSPLVQRWLTTGVGVTSADSEGVDDIMRL